MEWLKLVHGSAPPTPLSQFGPGDDVRVWYRILEQGKERLGQFEGTVIRVRGSGHAKTFTVRRVTYGEGVERVFPIDSKTVSRVEVLRQGKVRRSRLYFLRRAVGKTRIASADTAAEGNRPAAGSAATPGAPAGPATEKSEGVLSAAPAASQKPADTVTRA